MVSSRFNFILEEWLKNDMKGFEFGSGRSTKWFTQRVSFYFSTEGDFEWYKKSVEINKEKNIKNNKCEIVFKDAGDQVKIDENKLNLIHLLYQNLRISTLILV